MWVLTIERKQNKGRWPFFQGHYIFTFGIQPLRYQSTIWKKSLDIEKTVTVEKRPSTVHVYHYIYCNKRQIYKTKFWTWPQLGPAITFTGITTSRPTACSICSLMILAIGNNWELVTSYISSSWSCSTRKPPYLGTSWLGRLSENKYIIQNINNPFLTKRKNKMNHRTHFWWHQITSSLSLNQ